MLLNSFLRKLSTLIRVYRMRLLRLIWIENHSSSYLQIFRNFNRIFFIYFWNNVLICNILVSVYEELARKIEFLDTLLTMIEKGSPPSFYQQSKGVLLSLLLLYARRHKCFYNHDRTQRVATLQTCINLSYLDKTITRFVQ